MSDVGRYRKLFPRIWRHPGFTKLKPAARELALYLLTGPQSNRIGLFPFSLGLASEDLGVGRETLLERLADVRVTFGWHFDADARVFWIPSWWRWNAPENANVLRGNLKDLSEITPCALADAFAANIETLPETLHDTFVEGCRLRLPEGSPTQEQDLQEHKHEQDAGARRAPRELRTKNSDEKLVTIARRVLQEHNPPNLESAIDHLGQYATCTRAQAEIALTAAFAERRATA